MGLIPYASISTIFLCDLDDNSLLFQCQLFYTSLSHYIFDFKLVGYIELCMITLTSLWDGQFSYPLLYPYYTADVSPVLLLVTFYRYRRVFRQVNMHEVMTLSLLIRLFVFCMLRLTFTVYVRSCVTESEV